MYLVAIGWLYVALMMAIAEATNTTGTLLGAIVTFFLYGVGPVALVLYLMGTPARRKAIKAREAAERTEWMARQQAADPGGPMAPPMPSGEPNASRKAAAAAEPAGVAPMRKEL